MLDPLIPAHFWRLPGELIRRQFVRIRTMFGTLKGNSLPLVKYDILWVLPIQFTMLYLRLFQREQGLTEVEIGTVSSFQLVAQMIWYFLEGHNFSIIERPAESDPDFTKYLVPCESEELIFFKSALTERWWVEVPNLPIVYTKSNSPALLPCTERDYLDACNQNIPERWFKAYRKGFN